MKKKLSLPAWIFIGMVAGILVGLCFLKAPQITTDYFKPVGTIYINLLKFLVVPVVLFSIADGVITECGTHEELLREDGIYAKLYNTQNPNRNGNL